MRKDCRNEEATIRFMIEGLRGEDPFGGKTSLIDFA
jgi:hypothetical protein